MFRVVSVDLEAVSRLDLGSALNSAHIAQFGALPDLETDWCIRTEVGHTAFARVARLRRPA
jgi:hypothetical protein